MNKLVQQYDLKRDKYESSLELVEQLLVGLMRINNINYHSISGRLKTRESLEGKIIRKSEKYSDLDEITDVIGLRIITYTEDVIDNVRSLIEREFKIDMEHSIDKREKEPNEFGYSSLHLIVTLSNERGGLTEYKELVNIKFEIQVRTILQHAWAEIEHDIGYKSKTGIPSQLKRSFSRIASLLELADIEFVKILNETVKYGDRADKNLMNSKDSFDMEIDIITLKSYLKNSEIIRSIENDIGKTLNFVITPTVENKKLATYIEKLEYFSINKINLLNKLLLENESKIIQIANNMRSEKQENKEYVKSGISIFYLCYALLSESNDIAEIEEYLAHFNIGNSSKDALEFHNMFKLIE